MTSSKNSHKLFIEFQGTNLQLRGNSNIATSQTDVLQQGMHPSYSPSHHIPRIKNQMLQKVSAVYVRDLLSELVICKILDSDTITILSCPKWSRRCIVAAAVLQTTNVQVCALAFLPRHENCSIYGIMPFIFAHSTHDCMSFTSNCQCWLPAIFHKL